MELREHVQQIDELVSQGDMVGAINQFFSEDAQTSDYANVTTTGKSQMIEKMSGFLEAIEKVNGIEHHRTMVDGDASASEFTFDFNMKDGSKIYWHEIIRRIWSEGKVIQEQYFDAN
ncbi:MAG: SnoaL-like domain-containing protein [Ekhidna sp.]